MRKTTLSLLIIILVVSAVASCNKRYLQIDNEMSSSPSEHISVNIDGVKETDDEIADTSREINEIVSITITDIFEDTLNITSDTQNVVDTPPQDFSQISEYYYTLTKIDNQWYMVWNDYWDGEFEDSTLHYEKVTISSVDALKNAVPHGDLGEDKSIFFMKYVNADNYTQVPIYNVESIWRPVFSDKWLFKPEVYLYNGYYEFVGFGEKRGEEAETISAIVLREDDYDFMLNGLSLPDEYLKLQNQTKTVNYKYEYFYEDYTNLAYHIYDMFIEQGDCYVRINVQTFVPLTDEQILAFNFEVLE